MTEDRFDELIRSAARDYNRPGEVPRERMWERVQAARAEQDAPHRVRRTLSGYAWLWGGLAAAAVLAIGIGIGRWMERTAPGRAAVVAVTAPPASGATPDDSGRRVPDGVAPDTNRPDGSVARADGGGRLAVRAPDRESRPSGGGAAASSSAKRLAMATPRGGPGSTRAASPGADESAADVTDPAALAYRAVVLQHLAGTEAMLTSFRDVARSGSTHVDPQLASWARDQLATTRMLQASARTDDPTMQRLLDDLELVLTQIAQYTAGDRHRAEDARLIEQAIERHSVITRLRTIPAGIVSPGT